MTNTGTDPRGWAELVARGRIMDQPGVRRSQSPKLLALIKTGKDLNEKLAWLCQKLQGGPAKRPRQVH